MERAALSFVNWYISLPDILQREVHIFCGNGNNGGDGLAIARLLRNKCYDVTVYIFRVSKIDSKDFASNLTHLEDYQDVSIIYLEDKLPVLSESSIIIDAILGVGLNKPVIGRLEEIILHINSIKCFRLISIDISSGLPAEGLAIGTAIIPDIVFTFQVPKLSFFLPENELYCPEFVVGNIGLLDDFLLDEPSEYILLDLALISSFIKIRSKFSHKGSFGHALILAGSKGKLGATVLSTKACLRSGAGLVTAGVPDICAQLIHQTIPEAMVTRSGAEFLEECTNIDENIFTIGCGPGLGLHKDTKIAVVKLLQRIKKPIVLDADALNIIAEDSSLLYHIPENSILTPHPKEFDRLFVECNNFQERYDVQIRMSIQYKIIIVLKGAYSRISIPSGQCYINNTGNAGMATAGSGDVLTGIITGLLAQNYEPSSAAILGVYLHGLAGDIALRKQNQESLIASDIIDHLGAAFQAISVRS